MEKSCKTCKHNRNFCESPKGACVADFENWELEDYEKEHRPGNFLIEIPTDNVNHPKHYTSHPSGVECIDIVEHYDFCLGNALKYLWRAGIKSENPIEDLKKAKWYIERKLKKLEGEDK
jgi:hypothetical protein